MSSQFQDSFSLEKQSKNNQSEMNHSVTEAQLYPSFEIKVTIVGTEVGTVNGVDLPLCEISFSQH